MEQLILPRMEEYGIKDLDIVNYVNFAFQAIRGLYPAMADQIVKEKKSSIYRVADFLSSHMTDPEYMKEEFADPPIVITEIHRGVVLEQAGLKKLRPDKSRQYISFSEEIEIAKSFGDPNDEMSFTLPGNYGYLIHHHPEPHEIIWHYLYWGYLRDQFELLIHEMFNRKILPGPMGSFDPFEWMGEFEDMVAEQKEVMLKQQGQFFKMKFYTERR